MCPAEKCVPGGGARGPRPTGQVRYPPVGDGVPQWSAAEQMPLGYDVPSARQRRTGRRIPTPVTAGHAGPALRDGMLNRVKRDVEDAVPYGVHGRGGERWGKMFTLAALTLGNYYCIIN